MKVALLAAASHPPSGGGGGGGGPYVASAVHFDGTVWAKLASMVTADSPYFSFSAWVRVPAAFASGAFGFFFRGSVTGTGPYLYGDASLNAEAFDISGDDGVFVTTAGNSFVYDSTWKHIFGWLDNTDASGKVYIDGVDITFSVDSTGTPATSFSFVGQALAVPHDPVEDAAGGPLIMDMADVWIAPGVLEKDVTKFRALTGKPTDPSTFPAAGFILTGDKDHFFLNATGTEGALTIQTGSLTDVTNGPSAPTGYAAGVSDAQAVGADVGLYTAQAVHIDNTTPSSVYLSCPALTSADNGFLSFVVWVKAATFVPYCTLFVVDPLGNYLSGVGGSAAEEQFFILAKSTGGNTFETFYDLSSVLSVWVCLIGSVQTDMASGSKRMKLYAGDTAVSVVTGGDSDSPFNVETNGLSMYLFDDTFSDSFTGDVADFRIMPGISLLDGGGDIPEATRRLFIDAGGKPVNPTVATAALGEPVMLFSGDASTFVTNQGTGGAFTLHGALTNAFSSPSD